LVVLFIASITSVPLNLTESLIKGAPFVWLYASLYVVWVAVLLLLSARIGRFRPLAVLLYPLPLLVFFAVFVYSFAIRVFHGNVKWKGRAIKLDQ